MAFDTIILRREWENSSSAAVPFFWVCFQMEHESEIWLLFSSWFYTTDLSRAFCLSETFIVPPCLSVALFLPFADLCRFIVFHIPEPCLAIPFRYLSCCQQGFFFFFLSARFYHSKHRETLMSVLLNQIKCYSYAVTFGELCDVQGKGDKMSGWWTRECGSRYFETFDLALRPCEGSQINLCFWYKNNKNLHVKLYATYLKKSLGDFQQHLLYNRIKMKLRPNST